MQCGIMAGQPQDNNSVIGPSFWVLFLVGLVIVLSLFRGFSAAVQNAGIQAKERRRGKRKTLTSATSMDSHQD